MIPFLLRSLFLLLCTTAATFAAPLTRSEVLGTAASYVEHRWQPTTQNVRHGKDGGGILISTPDATTGNADLWQAGQPTVGVPYKWGGFDTLESFMRGVRTGKAAGDLYNAEKRRLGGKAVSGDAVGLDCSGFISRCWKLAEKQSTSSLPDLCVRLRSASELRPGDALNQPGGHVVLFVKWMDDTQTRFLCYEAEPFSRVRASERHAPDMIASGYSPIRYKKIVD